MNTFLIFFTASIIYYYNFKIPVSAGLQNGMDTCGQNTRIILGGYYYGHHSFRLQGPSSSYVCLFFNILIFFFHPERTDRAGIMEKHAVYMPGFSFYFHRFQAEIIQILPEITAPQPGNFPAGLCPHGKNISKIKIGNKSVRRPVRLQPGIFAAGLP